ncbi:hypothetical protein CKO28_00150 [Rhodovibrio sodomensis]|uniref:VWFA domain-containing protein n=1 Tax=Rhodovibrio sodomensis TaxID=1088 RepID=A0ABS1D7X8_9PROT|nr:VWA domain-containing protein [Rhodovibrio sodomensis]MBK1666450.1 hypothetical protein [Rhodovibrio sodomensis]
MRGATAAAQQGQTNQPAQTPTNVMAGDQGILAHELMVEIMGIVPTFGNTKINVGFYGDEAFASDQLNYVNIPQLPPQLVVPTPIAMELRGFAAHEASHLIWTDWDFMENGRTDAEKKDALLHHVWNAIEDYMIERNFLEIYPGAHKNFTATEIRCCAKYMEQWRQKPDIAKDLRIVGTVALTWARSIYFGLKTQSSKDCMDTMPVTLQQRVWTWFNQIIDVESSEECFQHARRIAEEIRKDPFDPNDPPADPNHDPLANQQQGQGGQSQGGIGGNGAGQQSPQGNAGGGLSNGGSGGGQQNGPTPMGVGHSLNDAFDDMGVEKQSHYTQSYAITSNAAEGPAADVLADPQGTQRAQDAQAKIADQVGITSRTLRRALRTISRERWRGGRNDGLLDGDHLTQAVMGAPDIYRKKRKAEKIDTAVEVVVDCSDSMRGQKLKVCQQLGLVLHQAFAGTPIKYEMIGYTCTDDEQNLPQSAQVLIQAMQARGEEADVRAIPVYVFKDFEANHSAALTSLGNMTEVPRGGTPTTDAIYAAHKRLAKRPERRHVMFVLTDGASDDNQACKRAVEAVEKCGVTVLGLGIQSDAVKGCFKNWASVSDAKDISAAVLGTLAKAILGDKLKKGMLPSYSAAHLHDV